MLRILIPLLLAACMHRVMGFFHTGQGSISLSVQQDSSVSAIAVSFAVWGWEVTVGIPRPCNRLGGQWPSGSGMVVVGKSSGSSVYSGYGIGGGLVVWHLYYRLAMV